MAPLSSVASMMGPTDATDDATDSDLWRARPWIQGHGQPVTALVGWLDGHLVVAEAGSLRCLDLNRNLSLSSALTLAPADDPILSLTVHAPSSQIWTAHRSGLIRHSQGPQLTLIRTLKSAHIGPIPFLAVDAAGSKLASLSVGQSASLRVWDLPAYAGQKAARAPSHHPTAMLLDPAGHLNVGTVLGPILVYRLDELGRAPQTLERHKSGVAALAANRSCLVAAGRDQILTVWSQDSGTLVHLIPVFEDIQTLAFSTAGRLTTGGSRGQLRGWDLSSGQEMTTITDLPTLKGRDIKALNFSAQDELRVWQEDLVFSPDRVQCLFQEPLTDLCLITEGREVVLSTMENALKIMSVESLTVKVFDTPHQEGVVALAGNASGGRPTFASLGKRREIFVWQRDDQTIEVLAQCVNAAAITQTFLLDRLLFTGDVDGILKTWALEPDQTEAKTIATTLSHGKEVKAIDVDSNRGLILTASLDKTAKIWRAEDMQRVAALSGHRRGVIAAKFSHCEPQIISSSLDGAVKIWNIGPYDCARTLEGLLSPACDLLIHSPKTLISLSLDGAFTIWKTNENAPKLAAYNHHEAQAWKMVQIGDQIISCGTNNQFLIWDDNTQNIKLKKEQEQTTQIKLMQSLDNALKQGKLDKAVLACLRLKQTRKLHEILSNCPNQVRTNLIQRLPSKYLQNFLKFSIHLNQNTRTFLLGQEIFSILIDRGHDLSLLESAQIYQFLSFSQKHYERVSKELAKVSIVDLLLKI